MVTCPILFLCKVFMIYEVTNFLCYIHLGKLSGAGVLVLLLDRDLAQDSHVHGLQDLPRYHHFCTVLCSSGVQRIGYVCKCLLGHCFLNTVLAMGLGLGLIGRAVPRYFHVQMGH